jgi:hypothetical protein
MRARANPAIPPEHPGMATRASGDGRRAGPPGPGLAPATPGTGRLPQRRHQARRESHGMPRAQIKDEKMYQELRKQGNSKEKSARIANAAAGSSRHAVAKKGGKSPSYTDWSKQDLLKQAKKIGIKGRSSMNKSQLIDALRSH